MNQLLMAAGDSKLSKFQRLLAVAGRAWQSVAESLLHLPRQRACRPLVWAGSDGDIFGTKSHHPDVIISICLHTLKCSSHLGYVALRRPQRNLNLVSRQLDCLRQMARCPAFTFGDRP